MLKRTLFFSVATSKGSDSRFVLHFKSSIARRDLKFENFDKKKKSINLPLRINDAYH